MRFATVSCLLTALAASVAANPVQTAAEVSDISLRDDLLAFDKRAGCQQIVTWQGGGCSALWAFNRCKNRCNDHAGEHGCCKDAVTSSVTSNPGCVNGFKVCGCGCLK